MITGTQQAKSAFVNGNPTIHDAALLDRKGEPFPGTPTTLMEKFDEQAAKKVELSRGTLWLLATFLVLAGVVFSYGSSLIGWIRDDESNRAKTIQIQAMLEAVQKSQEQMNQRMERIERDLQEQRIATARKEGYELKAAEGDHGANK